MGPSERELREHDQWAEAAVEMVHSLSGAQQHNLLMHIFRTAAYVQATGAKDLAIDLCHDVVSTVELRRDPEIRSALDDPRPVNRRDAVPVEQALEKLASR